MLDFLRPLQRVGDDCLDCPPEAAERLAQPATPDENLCTSSATITEQSSAAGCPTSRAFRDVGSATQNPAPKGRHKTAQGVSPGSAQNQTEAPQGITISPGDCDPEILQINPESIPALGSLANPQPLTNVVGTGNTESGVNECNRLVSTAS